MTAEVGAVIDNDYYPDHGHKAEYNWTQGEKTQIIKIWWLQTSIIRQGAYALLYVPMNVIFHLPDITNNDFDKWIFNRTDIECLKLQNVEETNLKCEIDIVCTRVFDLENNLSEGKYNQKLDSKEYVA